MNINCLTSSSYKYVDTAGQVLDSSKLTNIKEHLEYDAVGTHMYVAEEGTATCVGKTSTATTKAPNNDCTSIHVGQQAKCANYYFTKDTNSYLCMNPFNPAPTSNCYDPTSMGAGCPEKCQESLKCTIK